MAKIQKAAKAAPPAPETGLQLPKKKSEPRKNLADYLILIYGDPKVGKTTLISRIPNTFFLMMEPGGKALNIYQPMDKDGNPTPVQNWETFLQYVDLLEQDKRFQTVCIDTVDLAYQLCQDYVCGKKGFEHPHDAEDYGKTWTACKVEFHRTLIRLGAANKGIVLLSHAKDKEMKSRSGISYQAVVPTMSNQAWEVVEPLVDCLFFYTYSGKRRILQVQGDEMIAGGCRMQNEIQAFMDPDGMPLFEIDMGGTPDQSCKNLLDAFKSKYTPPKTGEKE